MKKHLSTDCIHAGEDRHKPHDSITTPIIQSSTFVFKNSEEIRQLTQEKHSVMSMADTATRLRELLKVSLPVLKGQNLRFCLHLE